MSVCLKTSVPKLLHSPTKSKGSEPPRPIRSSLYQAKKSVSSFSEPANWRDAIAAFLAGRRLMLHPRKTFIARTAEPATFLGYILSPKGRRLPDENVTRFLGRLRSLRDRWRAGTVNEEEVRQRVSAWIAHAEFADTEALMATIFRDGWFDPAAGKRDRSKARRVVRGGALWCASSCRSASGRCGGTTIHRTCAQPTATGTNPRTGTTTSGFASPVRSNVPSRRVHGPVGS